MTDLSATLGTAAPRPGRLRRLLTRRLDHLAEAALTGLAAHIATGRLTLTLADGQTRQFGDAATGGSASLHLTDPAAARRILIGGDVGFAESYIDGQWQTDDLPALIGLILANQDRLGRRMWGLGAVRLINRLGHIRRANTRRGSRRNIAQHYDLGNDFYRLWLDDELNYSAGLYHSATDRLETAQRAKNQRVAALLDLRPGLRVLEIGCGWGALAAHLVQDHGSDYVGVTLSAAQLAWATDRLGPTVDLRLQDYRDITGQFDRLVSIEMIEAVGEEHWPRYFTTLHDRLVPGGTAVIQAITIEDRRFAHYRQSCDFIQRHVFPGGMLPCPAAIHAQAARAGLTVERVQSFGPSYGQTLADWRRRFHAALPAVAALGFDGRFQRLWDYYLAYCEAGFRGGAIDVGLWRLRRPEAS